MTATDNKNSLQNTMFGSSTERYLSFSLGHEEYAVRLLTVKEVIAIPEVTAVPQTPTYFMGIMNLRGQVISVIDLRTKLGIKATASQETAVIIFDLEGVTLGVVVDSVNSVLTPAAEEVSDKPDIQANINHDYIEGVYRNDKRLVLFLNIARALGIEDIRAASHTAKAA